MTRGVKGSHSDDEGREYTQKTKAWRKPTQKMKDVKGIYTGDEEHKGSPYR